MNHALLLRTVPLFVRDISSGGCLIESSTPLQVGTVGWLEVEFDGERRFEWFRIAHVQNCRERVCLAGVEFLPLAAAGVDSLRGLISRAPRAMAALGSPEGAGGSSGDHRNNACTIDAAPAESSPRTPHAARNIVDFFRRR
jgi:hypothetical protein